MVSRDILPQCFMFFDGLAMILLIAQTIDDCAIALKMAARNFLPRCITFDTNL